MCTELRQAAAAAACPRALCAYTRARNEFNTRDKFIFVENSIDVFSDANHMNEW
jgi:hypothetical protein